MTTTVKAKCPGCGDEEGSQERRELANDDGVLDLYDILWTCCQCNGTSKVSEWFQAERTLTDADIEAIASRVVELMRDGS